MEAPVEEEAAPAPAPFDRPRPQSTGPDQRLPPPLPHAFSPEHAAPRVHIHLESHQRREDGEDDDVWVLDKEYEMTHASSETGGRAAIDGVGDGASR